MKGVASIAGKARFLSDLPEPTVSDHDAIVRPILAAATTLDAWRCVAHQSPSPLILGHQFVGVVERGAHAVGGLAVSTTDSTLVGKRVVVDAAIVCGACPLCQGGLSSHCRQRKVLGIEDAPGCFAERVGVPVRNLVEVPESVTSEAALFAEPLAAAAHAAQLVRLQNKAFVTVVGDSVEALVTALVMSRHNASVRVLGSAPDRLTICDRWGLRHRPEREAGRRCDQDVVVECTGTGEGLTLAMELLRPRGTLILKHPLALLPAASRAVNGAPANFDHAGVASRELAVVGASRGKLSEGVRLLSTGKLDLSGLISRRVTRAELPALLTIGAGENAATPPLDQGFRVVVTG
ncbi:MAG: alcohol dehydrogenase catalytic domain-containing protein [Planctomycetota bacterium]|nr:alcohol dehydrogenase catalytic domain-containing protein [Planctomycetota bacterium]